MNNGVTNMRRVYEAKYVDRAGRHSYDVEAYVAGSANERVIFKVSANNRDQAARLVERDGHRVNSVNMVG